MMDGISSRLLVGEKDVEQVIQIDQLSKWLPLADARIVSKNVKIVFPDNMVDSYSALVQKAYKLSHKYEVWSDTTKKNYIIIAEQLNRLAKEVFKHKRQKAYCFLRPFYCYRCPTSCAEFQVPRIAKRLKKELDSPDHSHFYQKLSPRNTDEEEMKYDELGTPAPPQISDSLESLLGSSALENPAIRELLLSSIDKSTEDHRHSQSQ